MFNIFNKNYIIMKLRLVVVLLVVFGLSACSQYTCPTYTDSGVEKNDATSQEESV